MSPQDYNRRDFNKLAVAAFGGAVAGSMLGCGGGGTAPTPPAESAAPKVAENAAAGEGKSAEWHLCRGLNSCKEQGADHKNACAGQGTCASASVHHSCAEANGCKGQGGCGADPGANECKGKGGCSVPLMGHAWEKVRERFKGEMEKKGKTIGEAPEAKES